jgi:hypothetical protein
MSKVETIKIYSVFHKEALIPKADFVIPIQVGAATAKQRLSMLHDDEGDNISRNNAHYSELTACYWLWKHAPRNENEAWGLCHYRLYFQKDKRKLFFIKKSRVYYEYNQQTLDAVVDSSLYERVKNLLQDHNVILQRPVHAHKKSGKVYTIEEAYSLVHSADDWSTTVEILLEKYPEYKESIKLFNKQTKMSYYNMMIASWPVWDGYLSWIFNILFEVQKRIPISKDPYQARVFGFISERLLNLYVFHNKLRPAYLTIALYER